MADFVYVNPDSTDELQRRGVLDLERDRYQSLSERADLHFITFGSLPLSLPNSTHIKTTSKILFYLFLPLTLLRHRAPLYRSYRQFYCSAITAVVAKLLGRKFVASVHGQYEEFSRLRHGSIPLSKRLSESIVLSLADAFVVSSHSLARYLSEKTDKKIYVNPASQPGIDPAKFYPVEVPREKTILFVGRISPEKNVPLLLSTFEKFSQDHPDFTLRLVVSKMTKIEEKFASSLKEADNIEILENVPNEEMPDLYRRASLFVLPSVTEGCPHALLEAIACGCPVVATKVGDNPKIVTEKSGRLVSPNDPDALLSAMEATLPLKVPPSESDRIRDQYSTSSSIQNELNFLNSIVHT